jgi:hypothetical protein
MLWEFVLPADWVVLQVNTATARLDDDVFH